MLTSTTTLTTQHAGQRIDTLLVTLHPGLGRAEAARLCAAGRVRLDGRRVAKGVFARDGQVLEITGEFLEGAPEPDAAVDLRVEYEDAGLVVLNKSAGQPSHPLRAEERGTLAQGLLARYPEMAGIGYSPREAGLVHRLDTGTSGLILAARNGETFDRLRALLGAGGITKHYRALCVAPIAPGRLTGWLDARGPTVRVHDHDGPHNRPISLEILGCQACGPHFEIEVSVAHAGRHQVRAQLAAAGAPLVGDVAYGGPAGVAHHQLHASRLAFIHPNSGVYIDLHSAPPWSAR